MKKCSCAAAILSLMFPLTMIAQANERFAPLAFLMDSCFKGFLPDGKTSDEHCFSSMYNGNFVRDQHVVCSANGKSVYGGETVYGWNPANKVVEFRYWSVDGLVLDGTLSAKDSTLTFPSRYATAAGYTELESVWTRIGANSYKAVTREKSAAGWKETLNVTYRRTR